MWTARPVWALLLTVLAMLAASLSAAGAALVPGSPPVTQAIVAGALPTVAALLLVLGWRRVVGRPWRGVALAMNRFTLPWLLLGTVPTAAAMAAADALSVAVGAGTWTTLQTGGLSPWMIAVLLLCTSLLMQAFPEELLWRGNLTDLLGARLRPRTVLILTSIGFGALHIISQGGQETAVDHLMYVVMAIGLGFACGAARLGTGSTWAAVGVHLGLHLGNAFTPVEPRSYPVVLALQAAVLGLVGAGFLAGSRVRRPAPGGAEPRPDTVAATP